MEALNICYLFALEMCAIYQFCIFGLFPALTLKFEVNIELELPLDIHMLVIWSYIII